MAGLVAQGALRGGEDWLANPALPEDVVRETVPGERERTREGHRSRPAGAGGSGVCVKLRFVWEGGRQGWGVGAG